MECVTQFPVITIIASDRIYNGIPVIVIIICITGIESEVYRSNICSGEFNQASAFIC